MEGTLGRAVRAAKIPFGFALVFSVYAVTGGKSAAEKMGLSPYAVVAIYVGIAVIVTLLIVLFGAWATSRARGAAVGYLGAALVALIFNFTLLPATDVGMLTFRQTIVYMLIFGLLGAWVGFLYWEPQDDA